MATTNAAPTPLLPAAPSGKRKGKKRSLPQLNDPSIKRDEARSCMCTVQLVDRGTRKGEVLWKSGGVVVRTQFCGEPCFLTLRKYMPDTFSASHAVVNFVPKKKKPASELPMLTRSPISSRHLRAEARPGMLDVETQSRLDHSKFFIASPEGAGDKLVEAMPEELRGVALLSDYGLVAIDQVPRHVIPMHLDLDHDDGVTIGETLVVLQAPTGSSEEWVRLPVKVRRVEPKTIVFAADPTVPPLPSVCTHALATNTPTHYHRKP